MEQTLREIKFSKSYRLYEKNSDKKGPPKEAYREILQNKSTENKIKKESYLNLR